MDHQPRRLQALLAGTLLLSSAGVANATPINIDFTSSDQWGSGQLTGNTGSQTYPGALTVTATGSSKLTFNTPFDGGACPSDVACDGDGLGVAPGDEITYGLVKGEWLRIEFSREVTIISLEFLDLYAAGGDPSDPESEAALWSVAEGATRSASGTAVDKSLGGYLYQAISPGVVTSSILFTAGPPSNSDYSLARITIAPVSEPSTLALMAFGLAVAGLVGRRSLAA